MDTPHYLPALDESKFHCMHCGVYSAQEWNWAYTNRTGSMQAIDGLRFCVCQHCVEWSYWLDGELIHPLTSGAPRCVADMPAECAADYAEAASIVALSPRAAAALLRLALQKLMKHLGEPGDNINKDIASLVAKGAPVQLQRALDICRIAGNNAVHPGELDLVDSPDIVFRMFDLLNYVVRDQITRPKELNSLWAEMPDGARDGVAQRDA